ncbi:replication initiation protein [Lacihabitans soyangensis]|uniref:RepB family plasmid replication initiator protein n=1 Tax=Lacihabitans soyangensis TaxID=869394 RepID=A0AAE3KWG0_9BACT|nr:replication initiation protein [Lacihabitans soyangensis]MCP9765651.1 RepB family plasmid replication initiator protein [Lacihabitans soyangensis]
MAKDTVKELQQNPDYVILNNPLASPKFVRMIGKGKEIAINDIYTPKIFYDIASKLTPEHMVDIQRNQSVVLEIHLGDFLESIGANKKNYKHLIDSIETMQSNLLRWKEGDDIITTSIVTKSIHNPKTGRMEIFVDSDIAKRIIEVKEDGNFSFLKNNVFRLQNAQAIKLYPFFKSWLNHGKYSTDLERFKVQFNYNTSGYKHWSNFEGKVLVPAMEEINDKTDIQVNYEPTGDNLDGKRPRIKGLLFTITKKDETKLLIEQAATQEQALHEQVEQPGLFDKDIQLKEILGLVQKFSIQEKPSELAIKTHFDTLLTNIGFQAVKDGLLGMIESKAKPKTLAFFTADNLLKYPGFEQAQKEVKKEKTVTNDQLLEEIKKQRTIDELRRVYQQERSTFLTKYFEEMDPVQKEKEIEELWNSSGVKVIYFRGEEKSQPNSNAVKRIAEKYAFPNGYDEKKHLKHFALQNFKLHIDFDEKGEIVLG